MNLPAFATRLGWPDSEVLSRLRELELTRPCSRCGGTGRYTLSDVDNQCWKCRGKGDELPMLTRELAGQVAVLVARGGLYLYFARQRRRRVAARAIPGLLKECAALYKSVLEWDPDRARALFFGWADSVSVRRVEKQVDCGEIDAETAEVLLRALHAQLKLDPRDLSDWRIPTHRPVNKWW